MITRYAAARFGRAPQHLFRDRRHQPRGRLIAPDNTSPRIGHEHTAHKWVGVFQFRQRGLRRSERHVLQDLRQRRLHIGQQHTNILGDQPHSRRHRLMTRVPGRQGFGRQPHLLSLQEPQRPTAHQQRRPQQKQGIKRGAALSGGHRMKSTDAECRRHNPAALFQVR